MIKFRLLVYKTLFWFLLFIIISIFAALVPAFFWWLVSNGFDKVVRFTFCWKWSFIVLSGISVLERIITFLRIMYYATIFHLKYKVPGKGLATAIQQYNDHWKFKGSKDDFIKWLKANDWGVRFKVDWKEIVFFTPFL